MRSTPGAIEAQSGLEEDRPEVQVRIDREKASELGVGVGAVAQMLRPAMASEKVSTWEDPGGEQHDVIVRLPKSARRSVEQLAALPLAGRAASIPRPERPG